MDRKKIIVTFRKLHKWPGILIAIFAIHFAISGIIMNHRGLFSGADISRKWLPGTYEYKNWNLAAVRGGMDIGADSLLLFGNIGTWIKTGTRYIDYNQGFPKGIDNRKINQLISFKGRMVAATQFGLFQRNPNQGEWRSVTMPVAGERLVDLFIKHDTLVVLSRNFLSKSVDLVHFDTMTLPQPQGYSKRAGLFNTLWELHSGELFGTIGKLVVDLLGIVTILLSLTGLLHFFLPKLMRRRKKRTGSTGNLPSTFKLNLRWHNLVGYLFALFLIINTTAGIFLRPPLLIPIINSRVGIIPGTHLDNNNPWSDKLRKGTWNQQTGHYIFSTADGFYTVGEKLDQPMVRFSSQPPVSLMGCNVLTSVNETKYLIGSFSGMYIWDVVSGEVADYFTGMEYHAPSGMERPVSDHMVAGYVRDSENREWIFDYNLGIMEKNGALIVEMPRNVKAKSPVSLWNLSLEIHTGRIFESFIGMLYLLYIPVAGICVLMVLISGFMVWLLPKRKKDPQRGNMKSYQTKNGTEVFRVSARRSNAYLIVTPNRNILIDTGWRFSHAGIKRKINGLGLSGPLHLLILTHTHFDHCYNASVIRKQENCTIMAGEQEAEFTKGGYSPLPKGTFPLTRFLSRVGNLIGPMWFGYPQFETNQSIEGEYDLSPYSDEIRIISTPGHSAGSVSVIVNNEVAIVGDTLIGIYRNTIFPPFADDTKELIQSWGKLLETACQLFLPGHGKAITREILQREYDKYLKKGVI